MPRGFLVKRTSSCVPYSHKLRQNSDEDRSDGSSDTEHCNRPTVGSPDSGFSHSPRTERYREIIESQSSDRVILPHRQCYSLNSTPSSSPTYAYGKRFEYQYSSPFHVTTFDRLCVSSPESTIGCLDLSIAKSTRLTPLNESTLSSPNKRHTDLDRDKKPKTPKKSKAIRKISFDDDNISPVSGTIIKSISEEKDEIRICGDIDSAYNIVEVTAEARAELDKIENKIGAYVCQLCKELFGDAFLLAQHRCPRIVHVEYRCPDCDKIFNCPANLASHRRWHKPKQIPTKPVEETNIHSSPALNNASLDLRMTNNKVSSLERELPNLDEPYFSCDICNKKFRRQAYLKKHVLSHLIKRDSKVYPYELSVPSVRKAPLMPPLCDEVGYEHRHYPHEKISPMSNLKDMSVDRPSYICKYCRSKFWTFSHLAEHNGKYHSSESSVMPRPLTIANDSR